MLVVTLLLMVAVTATATTRGAIQPPLFAHRTSSQLLANPPTSELMPRAPAPPLTLSVLGDDSDAVEDDWEWRSHSAENAVSQPIIYSIQKPGWGFSEALWSLNSSIDALLTKLPRNFQFTFISDAATNRAARKATAALKARMTARGNVLNLTDRVSQMVFATKSLNATAKSQPWITQLLCEWPTIRDNMHASIATQTTTGTPTTTELDIPMLNSFYDWLGWAFWPSGALGNRSLPVAVVDPATGCAPITTNLNNTAALIFDTGACDAYVRPCNPAVCVRAPCACVRPVRACVRACVLCVRSSA